MALTTLETNIVLDVYDHDGTRPSIKAIALDDNTRYVFARLTYQGNTYDIGSGATVKLVIIRPDKVGAQVAGEAKEIQMGQEDESLVTIYGAYAELDQPAIAVAGTLLGQFVITSGDQILRSQIFAVNNGEALDADEWAGQYDGYNLDELVERVDEAVDKVYGMEEDVNELKSGLSDISTTGMNLFNKDAVISGKVINLQGGENGNANFYCTDYIAVEPSTDYKIGAGVGSASAYLTCAFYDSDKVFIGPSFNASTGSYTVTTPSNCAYIRLNGALSRVDNQSITIATAMSTPLHQLIVDGKNEYGVRLFSQSDIFYDKANGTLKSNNPIYVLMPDCMLNLGKSVDVGTDGGYLLFNKKTGILYASADRVLDGDIYTIAILSSLKEFEPHKQYCTIDSAFPIFKVDFVSNLLVIEVKERPAYLIYNGVYHSIPSGYSQSVQLPNHCVVGYNPIDKVFVVVWEFNNYLLSSCIPVMSRYYTQITCRVPYETIIFDGSYKRFVCYGDSLTWYDGNAFTWGEHEGETCVGFESYIRSELQARAVANRGESGKTTPQICSKILTATDLSNYDVLTIMGGDNDDRLDVSIGTIQPVGGTFDTTTVCGALQSAIEYAISQNPNLRIILMTEPIGWTYQNGTMDRVSELVPNAYRNVAKQYGLPVIDLWNESGINELTRETFYADPAPSDNQLYMYHPNNDGWVRCSKIIVKHLKAYI